MIDLTPLPWFTVAPAALDAAALERLRAFWHAPAARVPNRVLRPVRALRFVRVGGGSRVDIPATLAALLRGELAADVAPRFRTLGARVAPAHPRLLDTTSISCALALDLRARGVPATGLDALLGETAVASGIVRTGFARVLQTATQAPGRRIDDPL